MNKSIFLLGAVLGTISARAAILPPSNPNASAEVRKLHAYLQNLAGQGILSGQLSMLNEATDDTTNRERYVLSKNGGRMPAIYASNFGDWPMTYQDSIVRTIEHKWRKAGGQQVLMLCWHMVQPDAYEDSGYAVMSRFSATNPYPSWKIDSILKPGTVLNVEYMKRMKRAGAYLKQLDSAGIPVIWRPFHENNGAFFWWGQQPRFKELWRHMYTYYTDSLHLNNLLWAYSMCAFGEGDRWIDSLYPGHAYVDILGVDIYANSPTDFQPWIYQTLLSKAEGRPIGITENGMMPNVPVLKSTQPKWTFFCTWPKYEVDTMWVNDYYHPAGYSLQNSDALYRAVYGDPYTLTRDQIDFGIAPDSHVFLSTGVSPAGGGRVVVSPDSNGRYNQGSRAMLTAVPTEGWVFTGWKGDTSGTTNPLTLEMSRDRSVRAAFTALVGTNLLLDGKFSNGIEGWSFSAWETGAAATTAVEGADSVLHIHVTGTGPDPWGVQLTQGVLLDSGARYTLSYDVHGQPNSRLTCAVGEAGGKYAKLFEKSDTLSSTGVRTVTGTFVDTWPSSDALRIEFSVGAQLGDLYIDNVKIALKDVSAQVGRSARSLEGMAVRRTRAGVEWKSGHRASGAVRVRATGLDGRLVAEETFASGTSAGVLTLPGRNAPVVVSIAQGSLSRSWLLAP